MGEPRNGPGIGSEAEIADQLRQYADALAARADRNHIGTAIEPEHERQPRRRSTVFALVAVAVVAVIGSASWLGLRQESNSIRSTSNDRQSTTTQPSETSTPDTSVAAESHLMPDTEVWTVTETFPSQTSDDPAKTGVWAWRIDGTVFVLLDGVALDGLGPLAEAPIEVADGRTMIAWLEGDDRLGLQGYGTDEQTIRSVAAGLEPTETGWSVPGADVLIAEPAGDSGPSESIQVGYSPRTSNGTADLSTVVTGIHRDGTAADMYRELFEASSTGEVSEISVAGERGFLVAGTFASHALTFGGGVVSSWSAGPDVDLAAMLATISAVSPTEWNGALAGADEAVSEAIAATLDDPDQDLNTSDPADDPYLPRYRLPEQWTPIFVTDMGLWSQEERAKRDALDAAHAPPGGFATLIWTQGFARSAETADRDDRLPFAVPDIVVEVYRRETDEPLSPEPQEGEPFTIAGLDGFLEEFEAYDPTTQRGSRTEFTAFAAQGFLLLRIEAPFSTEDEIRRFAASLLIPEAGLSRGVTSASDEFRLILELPEDTGGRSNFYRRWLAAYSTSPITEDGRPEASVRVESTSFELLQLRMMQAESRGYRYEPVPETDYLAVQNVNGRTSLLRYDPEAQVAVELDLAGDLAAAITLMEELTEVDIDTWRAFVEPYNAKPLEPR